MSFDIHRTNFEDYFGEVDGWSIPKNNVSRSDEEVEVVVFKKDNKDLRVFCRYYMDEDRTEFMIDYGNNEEMRETAEEVKEFMQNN